MRRGGGVSLMPSAQGAKVETHWLNPCRAMRDGKRKSKPAEAMEEVAGPWEVLQASSGSDNSRGNLLIVQCYLMLQRGTEGGKMTDTRQELNLAARGTPPRF